METKIQTSPYLEISKLKCHVRLCSVVILAQAIFSVACISVMDTKLETARADELSANKEATQARQQLVKSVKQKSEIQMEINK